MKPSGQFHGQTAIGVEVGLAHSWSGRGGEEPPLTRNQTPASDPVVWQLHLAISAPFLEIYPWNLKKKKKKKDPSNSLELDHSSESNSCFASQEISIPSRNPKLPCRIHNSMTLDSTLSHTPIAYVWNIPFNIIFISTRRSTRSSRNCLLFCKMHTVFYTVKIVYICVFMMCSTSYSLDDTLADPWDVCMQVYVCIYVLCMYVTFLAKQILTVRSCYPPPRPQSAGPPIEGYGCIFMPIVTSHIWRNNSTMLQNNPQLSNPLLPIGEYLYNTHISSLSQHHFL
jgi:uncharacterized membrane protein